ncbi:unnamed protein product [Staurois parvus]|nr:unnamed protein product [Staurois parvus]
MPGKYRTFLKNISRTQDRNMAFPPCEISDVCERLDLPEKHFPHSGQEYGFLPRVRSLMFVKTRLCLKNISHTLDREWLLPVV